MKRIVALCLAAACLISMVGCAGDTNMEEKKPNSTASAYALALASYPEMAPYPNEMEYFDEKTGAVSRRAMQTVWKLSLPARSGSFSAIPTVRTRSTLP